MIKPSCYIVSLSIGFSEFAVTVDGIESLLSWNIDVKS